MNGDGTLDTNFVATITSSSSSFITVSDLALQTNSQVVIAGWFDTVNGVARTNIARLNSNGALDSGFVAAIDTPPNALALQLDGRVLIGGAFSTVNGQPRAHIACLNTNGSVDTNFLAMVLPGIPGVFLLVEMCRDERGHGTEATDVRPQGGAS